MMLRSNGRREKSGAVGFSTSIWDSRYPVDKADQNLRWWSLEELPKCLGGGPGEVTADSWNRCFAYAHWLRAHLIWESWSRKSELVIFHGFNVRQVPRARTCDLMLSFWLLMREIAFSQLTNHSRLSRQCERPPSSWFGHSRWKSHIFIFHVIKVQRPV